MTGFRFVDKISKLPKESGVYSFKSKKETLYIGKANNIRERVKNHFQQPNYKDNLFLSKIKKIGFIKTNNEIQALTLEAKLIKRYSPKFNVIWKDDKNYFYIKVTKDGFPRILITHQKKDKGQYIGPFTDGKAIKQTLKLLRKVFPFRSCRNIPKKPCLWYQLERCPAPCLLNQNLAKQIPKIKNKIKKNSQKNAKNIIRMLKGKEKEVIKDLEKEMKEASKLQLFEKAAQKRNQIKSLKRVLDHRIIIEDIVEFKWQDIEKKLKRFLNIKGSIYRMEAYDISNFQGKQATGSMVVFIEGKPKKELYRKFKVRKDKPNDIAMIKEVLTRRKNHKEWEMPEIILIDGGQAQLNIAKKIIKKGPKIVSLAKRNNRLFVQGKKNPIFLKGLPKEISDLFLQIRDEAHRFAITYHRKLRKDKLFD